MKVAFLGLGTMGYPMAGYLQRQGHSVSVWNRTQEKAQRWQGEYAGESAPSIGTAVAAAQLVCMCLGNDDDVRSVVYGTNGALAHMQPESILVDHTTTSAMLARELDAAVKNNRISFVDAPVSGGQVGAQQGQLTIMLGGTRQDCDRVEPVLAAYARTITRMGEVGSGQLAKMVNQICIVGVLQGLAEGLAVAKASNLDGAKLLAAIGKGAAQSWQMDNRGMTMLRDEFDFGFAVEWMIKDLSYCLEQADELGIKLPLTTMVLEQYRQLAAKGGGGLDTSSLFRSILR